MCVCTESSKGKTILLGLTTTPGSDWREKTAEIDKFGLREIALFPTCLEVRERQELYAMLEKTCIESIPHVHLRYDMAREELDYLIGRFNTRAFNIHCEREGHGRFPDYPEWRHMVYFENTTYLPTSAELDRFPGICIDFAHLQNARRKGNEHYAHFGDLLAKYPIGCCHVSAFPRRIQDDPSAVWPYEGHYLEDLHDLDYMAKYAGYLPDLVSIEVENPFLEQLVMGEYLSRMVSSGCVERTPG